MTGLCQLRMRDTSVLVQRVIDSIRPGEDAALKALNLPLTSLLLHLIGLRTATSHLAIHDNVVCRIAVVEALGQCDQGYSKLAEAWQHFTLPQKILMSSENPHAILMFLPPGRCMLHSHGPFALAKRVTQAYLAL